MNSHGTIGKTTVVSLILFLLSLLFVLNSFGDELLPLPDIQQAPRIQQTPSPKQEAVNLEQYREYIEQFTDQVSQLQLLAQTQQLRDGIFNLLDDATTQGEREFYWELLRIVSRRQSQLE